MSIFKFLVNHNKQGSFVNQFRQKRFDYLKNRIEKLIQKGYIQNIRYWRGYTILEKYWLAAPCV